MVQKIFGFGIGGMGTGGVLIALGLILKGTGIDPSLGGICLTLGIIIIVALGFLGIIGVGRRVLPIR